MVSPTPPLRHPGLSTRHLRVTIAGASGLRADLRMASLAVTLRGVAARAAPMARFVITLPAAVSAHNWRLSHVCHPSSVATPLLCCRYMATAPTPAAGVDWYASTSRLMCTAGVDGVLTRALCTPAGHCSVAACSRRRARRNVTRLRRRTPAV